MSGALIVVAATWSVRHASDATRTPRSRAPASINPSLRLETGKQNRLDQFEKAEIVGKVSSSFTVAIRGDDGTGAALEAKAEPATRVRLTGTITADRPLANHEYSWILPNGYRTSEGTLTGTVPTLQAGQKFDITITVDREQNPAQPIVLHVFKLVNSEARGQVAQFDIPDAKSAKEMSERLSRTPDGVGKYVQ